MKKYQSIFWSLFVVLFAGLSLTSCDEDDLVTDQYGNEIKLNSFGPCPVLRGGTLKFLGSNLDQITEVRLPGADPITAIDVKKSGNVSEIWIEVPKEKCEPGIVTLITAKGGEIKTITPVTYEENIVLGKVYIGQEDNLSGKVGDIVTFTGDYLNLMHQVVFADDVRVDEKDFKSHDRYTITVAIPKEARTGRPMLSDANPDGENLLYADDAITIALPTATSVAPTSLKAGATLTVSGTSLEQIEKVNLNGASVEADALTVASDGNTLTFALPETATDGEVTLVTYSGVSIPAGSIETVVPTNLSAAPAPVKNGADVTINGKDLDLVTAIAFPNADGELKTVAADKVVAAVPEAAQEGDITLTLANGKTVTVAYTLVKPTVTECTPSGLMAGNNVIIKGTDLDLVASVTLPGDPEQTVAAESFVAQSAAAIALTVPTACAGTGLKLNLKNGTTIEVSGMLTITPATDPAVSEMPAKIVIGEKATLKGKNFYNAESVYLGDVKVTKIVSKTNDEIIFTVPEMATGEIEVVFITPEGKRIVAGKTVVDVAEVDFATFAKYEDQSGFITYPFNFDWSDSKGKIRIFKADLAAIGLTAGKSKIIVYKPAGVTGQIQVNNCNWVGITTIADWEGTAEVLEYVIDQAFIDAVEGQSDGWSDTALILQGDMKGVTKMTILP